MRRTLLASFTAFFVTTAALAYQGWAWWFWPVLAAVLLGTAIHDVIQKRHSILRNFPVIGHLRFLLEAIRPEIQQYFIEADTSPDPISRIYRSFVYQKAKGELETVPFGSELDLYSPDYKWLNHSTFPVQLEGQEFRVKIGNRQCAQPYEASLFNISAMSYGSLSKAAIRALGRGAKAGGFYLNTGEGGLSPYHLESGCDLVWQIGTAYFGARGDDGYFSPECFKEGAAHPQVKMIEIKLSQGAKPAHGGILPGCKVDEEVAAIRRVPVGETVFSPPGHTAFTNPKEMCAFIAQLRTLSGGKPIGFKLCLGRREEFLQICEAMLDTQVIPDFITVDGGEGGTGAAPFDFINFVGSPLKEGLLFIHKSLEAYGLRQDIKLIAGGKILGSFDMFEKLALGADLCNSARGMMLALGCIQAYRCNTNRCPTGVATTDARLSSALDVADKGERVRNFHDRTVASLTDLMGAAGLRSPDEIELKHISCRFQNRIVTLEELFKETPVLSEHERRGRHREAQGDPSPPQQPATT